MAPDEAPEHARLHGRRRLLPRSLLARPATEVAPALLGALLVRDLPEGRVVARLVETEAYEQSDPSSHSHRGQTPRNSTMFGRAGHAYVYFTYGMHWCLNVSADEVGYGAAALLRAATVIEGHDIARLNRGRPAEKDRDLLRGPARLTKGLGLDKRWDGIDLLARRSDLRLETDGWWPAPGDLAVSGRTGVVDAPDVPWRFYLASAPEVSRYVRHPKAMRPA